MAKYKIQRGWLNTRDGKLYAPKTLIDNVYDDKTGKPYGEILEDHYEAFDELKGEVELLAQNSAEKGHKHTVVHKPAGTVSQPTFTGTAVNSGATASESRKTVYSITGVGTLPSAEYTAATLEAD